MKIFSGLAFMLSMLALLSSCTSSDQKKDKTVSQRTHDPVNQDGAMLYNGISLTWHNVKISKAYLVFNNNDSVPADNIIDFTSPVRAMIQVDSGWVEENGRVFLDASEKITTESGRVIAEQQDLYKDAYPDGVDAETAKKIWLMADIHPARSSISFDVAFSVRDKKGAGYIEGSYKLYTK